MPPETPERKRSADAFPETRWSLVLDARSEVGSDSNRALDELCESYW